MLYVTKQVQSFCQLLFIQLAQVLYLLLELASLISAFASQFLSEEKKNIICG